MKIALDSAKIHYFRELQGLTYEDIALQSGGLFTTNALKYLLNSGTRLPHEKAEKLAEILECDLSDILSDRVLRGSGIPGEDQVLVRNLYIESAKDVNVPYKRFLDEQRRNIGFQRLLQQAGALFEIFTRPSLDDAPLQRMTLARELILDECSPKGALYASTISLSSERLDRLLSSLARDGDQYVPRLAVTVFIYTLVLYDSIFLEELVSSAVQLSPIRHRDIVDQYFEIAVPIEQLKERYLSVILDQGRAFDDPKFFQTALDRDFYDDSRLILLACRRCIEHFESNFAASQYLNRKVVNAITTRLLRTARNVSIELPIGVGSFFETSRFGTRYRMAQMLRRVVEVPRERPGVDPMKVLESACVAEMQFRFLQSLFKKD